MNYDDKTEEEIVMSQIGGTMFDDNKALRLLAAILQELRNNNIKKCSEKEDELEIEVERVYKTRYDCPNARLATAFK